MCGSQLEFLATSFRGVSRNPSLITPLWMHGIGTLFQFLQLWQQYLILWAVSGYSNANQPYTPPPSAYQMVTI